MILYSDLLIGLVVMIIFHFQINIHYYTCMDILGVTGPFDHWFRENTYLDSLLVLLGVLGRKVLKSLIKTPSLRLPHLPRIVLNLYMLGFSLKNKNKNKSKKRKQNFECFCKIYSIPKSHSSLQNYLILLKKGKISFIFPYIYISFILIYWAFTIS